MASALYTTQLLSVQNIAPGSSVTCKIVTDGSPVAVVVRDISLYWGAPSVVAPQSVVFVWSHSQAGLPTFYGFNSGLLDSENPLFIHAQGQWVSTTIQGASGEIPVFTAYNTQLVSNAAVDVSVSGWVLAGSPSHTFDFSIP